MIVYINGVKATKKDIEKLNADLQKDTAKITSIKTTEKNAIAITTD
jgi:hypothetical protein